MVKKISIWSAAGQFFSLIEKELEAFDATDKGILDVFPMSDYQNQLTFSPRSKDLQVLTCPTVFDDGADYETKVLRRVQSCPVNITLTLPFAITTPSPIATSIESSKLNKATEEMIAFWNTNLTIRKKKVVRSIPTLMFLDPLPTTPESSVESNEKSSIPSIFQKFEGLFEDQQIESFFEKMDGYFKEDESLPSLFDKLKLLLDSFPEVFTDNSSEKHQSFLSLFGNYFSEKLETSVIKSSKCIPFHHKKNCMCFSCWREQGSQKVWHSEERKAPVLPVFVKSPVDSLKLYKCCQLSSCDDQSDSGNESDRDSVTCDCSTSSATLSSAIRSKHQVIGETQTSDSLKSSTQQMEIEEENEKLKKALRIQQEIIDKCLELNRLLQ